MFTKYGPFCPGFPSAFLQVGRALGVGGGWGYRLQKSPRPCRIWHIEVRMSLQFLAGCGLRGRECPEPTLAGSSGCPWGRSGATREAAGITALSGCEWLSSKLAKESWKLTYQLDAVGWIKGLLEYLPCTIWCTWFNQQSSNPCSWATCAVNKILQSWSSCLSFCGSTLKTFVIKIKCLNMMNVKSLLHIKKCWDLFHKNYCS